MWPNPQLVTLTAKFINFVIKKFLQFFTNLQKSSPDLSLNQWISNVHFA